jgi:DNA-damage-inducible protein J
MNIRMDSEIKSQAELLFAQFGINMTTAINMFLRQAVRQQAIPFELKLETPNAETVAALLEAEKISRDPNTKRYASFSELLSEVQNEV